MATSPTTRPSSSDPSPAKTGTDTKTPAASTPAATQRKPTVKSTKSKPAATRRKSTTTAKATKPKPAAKPARTASVEASGKKAGAVYLDACEKTVLSITDSYEKAARGTNNDWVAGMASAQADFTRQLTKAYVNAARELVS